VQDVSGKTIRDLVIEEQHQQLNLDLPEPGYYFLEIYFTSGQIIRKPVVIY
jgi:hypothetical protein